MNGGPHGDLYVEIHLKQHAVFQRDGDDLHCEVPIGFTTAALGGEVDVPTLNGKASLEIGEGTQSGKTYRLRGKGIKGVRSSYPGDLYCHVSVETPVRLTEKQKKLLREFDDVAEGRRPEAFAAGEELRRPHEGILHRRVAHEHARVPRPPLVVGAAGRDGHLRGRSRAGQPRAACHGAVTNSAPRSPCANRDVHRLSPEHGTKRSGDAALRCENGATSPA